jgi:hypothetical protein
MEDINTASFLQLIPYAKISLGLKISTLKSGSRDRIFGYARLFELFTGVAA